MKNTQMSSLAETASIARLFGDRWNSRITLDSNTDDGVDEAAAAAAKAAADKAAADKAAADKKLEDDKKTALSDDAAKLLKELMDKKQSEKVLKSKISELEATTKAIEDLGGIDTLKKLVDAQKSKEQEELERKGEFDRVKSMIVEENQKKVKQAEDARLATEVKLAEAQRVIDDLTIGVAFANSKVVEELVLPPSKSRDLFGAYFEREDGELVAYDLPRGKPNRVKLIDGDGNALPFEAALRKLVESDPDKDRLLKSKVVNGAGSKTMDGKSTEKSTALFGKDLIAKALTERLRKK
jgi:hypothetical protein